MTAPLAANVAAAEDTVTVALGERAYDILIGDGLIHGAGAEIAARLPGARAVVVTDETVAGLHLAALRESLAGAGIENEVLTVAAGEASKSFSVYQDLVGHVLEARLERGDVVVALGGGVVGDLAGFVAATVRRGMKFVQVPTTLLAQVDSSVGGKTGINAPQGKNLVGAFYQPALVVADTASLSTLPPRQFASGYAEVVKYGLIDDPKFFGWLERDREAVFAGGQARVSAIATSCKAKARVVAADEREGGVRALLNLGHTFGHALEGATGFSDRLFHGEGVAIGMCQAFRFSARMGLCPPADAERVESHLKAAGLPTRIADIPGDVLAVERLMNLIAQDKKVTRGTLTFVLARGIGKSFIARDIAADDISAFLVDELKK
ncbi:3-dehydroquinate synthase [Rhodobium orientis]|uniref:3-dehydroquinate synthase n=1 Tax=Rhodobium orientis TaxID=34017 RepID=A0A327JW34_9HYPH|nr:3-dehydroquinate synthase [Rhodobium orientis]MBB4304905.1 3-dehydroquinate synthase [Rhodobium orientis]MBK5949232.1 3-dehydroquinate synthase [Rhodobium orientis]RAI27398.1 3-dehydroquinate synthase [Rhodobium orientis]